MPGVGYQLYSRQPISALESVVQRNEMVNEYLRVLDLHDCELDYRFLCEVVGRHVATFAFSSVGSRLGEELPLDFESLFYRVVVRRRGGYCFEQNGILYEVLDELGFSPELYLARVIYDRDIHPGLTHRISTVVHGGQTYVLDVGFGPLGPRVPVLLSESETIDGDKVFRVEERRPGEYHMQVLKKGAFYSLYRFELARYGQSDCELGHFYSHRHPEATFVNHLVVSRILADEIRSLRDQEYWVIGASEKQTTRIGNPRQLRKILVEELGVQVTDEESVRLYG